jgi:hypothetical protein
MYYRAKHHARQTPGMREAMRVYGRFLRGLGTRLRTTRRRRL